MENRSAEFQPVLFARRKTFAKLFFPEEDSRFPLADSLVENVVEGTGKDTRNEIEGGLIPRDNREKQRERMFSSNGILFCVSR